MMSLIYFILIITILVFFHELGHYMAARSVGVKVEKFYIGFNLFGLGLKKMYNGTEYGLGLFPFGGYVKVAGVIDESLDDSSDENVINEDDYRSKNTFQKVWIMSAGVIMNVLVTIPSIPKRSIRISPIISNDEVLSRLLNTAIADNSVRSLRNDLVKPLSGWA